MSQVAARERWLVPAPAGPVTPLAQPPTFSVVITAYQAADTIGRALHSALSQSAPAHEVIVVDDGSTDELHAALGPFAGQIKLLRKDNGGGASAHNAADAVASGDFVVTLDADDTFDPRRLDALAELAMARPDLDIITTDARFIVEGRPAGTFLEANRFAVEDQRGAILRSCFPGGWPAVRLARLREIGGFDETLRVAYDWDCWLRLLLDGSLAGLVAEPYYQYVLHEGSLAASRLDSLWERVRLLEKAAASPSLRPAERPVLGASLRVHRSRAIRAEIGAGVSRRRLQALARSPGIPAALRARLALALLVPPLARRLAGSETPPPRRRVHSAS